jgi:hypothetical protein
MPPHIKDRVVAIVAFDRVIARTAHNLVIALPAPNAVAPPGVGDHIIARPGIDGVIAVTRR